MNLKFFFVLVLSLVIVYIFFGSAIESYLVEDMPWVIEFVSYAAGHLEEGSYEGLLFFSFSSTSPLFPIPSEFYMFHSYSRGYDPVGIVLFIAIGLTIGTFFHFMLGYIFGPRLVQFLLNKEIGVGGSNPLLLAFVFLAAAIPFFPDAIVMVYGAYRINPKKFFIVSFVGHLIRAVIVMYAIVTSATLFGMDLTQQDINTTLGTLSL